MTRFLSSISHFAFIDIETLPAIDEAVIAEIAAGVTHPANMSKIETIEAWEREKKPQAVLDAVAKTSFDSGYGRVASIARAHGNGSVRATAAFEGEYGLTGVDAEIAVIAGFFAEMENRAQQLGRPPIPVGHNVGFDNLFLWRRAKVLGIETPTWWPVHAAPWRSDQIFDTMYAWSGAQDRISQDRLCRILGLPGKGDFDGSMVAAAWAAGEYEKVRAYNAQDVVTLRKLWKRLTGYVEPARPLLRQQQVAA